MAASEQPPDLEPAGEDALSRLVVLTDSIQSLPLRSRFFKAPDLSDADQAELLSWGRSLVPDLRGGLTYSIRAVATVRASLDDVMDIFLAEITVDYRSLMQLLLREFFADAAVLFHKEQSASESLSIKWTAARTKKSVASLGGQVGVDLCLLEYVGVISSKLVDGPKQYNALSDSSSSNTSKNSPAECPSLYDSNKLERASVSNCGFLFRPHVDEGVNRALLAHWAQSVGGIEKAISRRRISKELTRRRVPTWVKDKDRARCHLCLKTFTNTRLGGAHYTACLQSLYGWQVVRDEANLKAAAEVTAAANGATADTINLPEGVDNSVLRDAVEEYALAVLGAQVSTVPDLVGIAWLQQLAARDDESKTMVNALMDRLRLDSRQKDVGGSIGEQVDIYDTLCDLAAQTLACKYAVVSLVDENRQWFKSAVNVKES
ncbi:hypothetical protein GN244_ATG06603 [Phytophthora infestans]|uniref:Uncharacterized protein n=1 Tax=Phytophthora infestans TaxID=4787 RepID=A0A833TCR6_PHYIN|nr:hypothetical protein GN244_ATG06603 [Phytophthora infestans]